LTGDYDELLPVASSHMDVNALIYGGTSKADRTIIESNAAQNVKRIASWATFLASGRDNPYRILDMQEIKTTWHPVGV
jgi:hypothetical protein